LSLYHIHHFFLSLLQCPLTCTLLPYTTLFRSPRMNNWMLWLLSLKINGTVALQFIHQPKEESHPEVTFFFCNHSRFNFSMCSRIASVNFLTKADPCL